MAIELPTSATEVDQRMKVDVNRELPNANSFLKNSWLGALVTAFANRIYDFYYALRRAELEAIPDTAVLNLEQWANIWNVIRKAASPAAGNLVVTGTAGGEIVAGGDPTIWSLGSGERFQATSPGTIVLQSLSITSITRSGTVATLTTASDHLIASNVLISITGSDQSDYNVTDSACTVTGDKTLTFTVAGSPTTPATGTMLLGFTSVSIPVQALDFGVDSNQLFDTELVLVSPLTDVDDSASVDYGALGGGADQETDTEMRGRMIFKIQNPIAHFNSSEIITVAKTIPGVTRVWVEEITPLVGQVTIYFMRDNDADPIPDVSEVAEVKAAIDGIMPGNTVTTDVIVGAPTEESTDFSFSAVDPDTSTMKEAVTASLQQFFAERTEVGVDVVEEAYNAAIFNTVDLVTGAELVSFTLTSPSADITVASGEIGTLGNVTF
jgi:uncharacterized phage protein gp47/JayE